MFKSGFASSIEAYLQYREGMHYGGEGEKKYLESFDAFCYENYPEEKNLTKETVRGWFLNEVDSGCAALENKAITIRMFARFKGPSSYMLPMAYVPKMVQYVPYILTDNELWALFNAADGIKYPSDSFMNEVIPVLLRFIYSCGLRPGESLRLKTDDINLENGEIFIRNTKRHKDRIIVASPDATSLLKGFDIKRKIYVGNSEHFFCDGSGNPITLHQLDHAVKRCWQDANPGVNSKELPRFRAYDLRHRFASAVLQIWIDEGKNLYAMLPYLRAYMGHQSFSDTAYYIHLLPDRLLKSLGIDWDKIDQVGLEDCIWNN